jgi:hypothetical protein
MNGLSILEVSLARSPTEPAKVSKDRQNGTVVVERVQTGIKLEKRLLKVLKGLAEYHDMTVGELLEGVVLHAFEGKCALGKESIAKVRDFKKIYAMDYGAEASHHLVEKD